MGAALNSLVPPIPLPPGDETGLVPSSRAFAPPGRDGDVGGQVQVGQDMAHAAARGG